MKLASLFSDHAVLQREISIPVWGWCQPGMKLKVTLGPYATEYFAGTDGKFMVRFPALPAGGPYELTATEVKSGDTAVAHDIWIGEVWLASGQSNMELMLSQLPKYQHETIPGLRMINLQRTTFAGRQSDFTAKWQMTTPEETANFSAVAYYFGKELQKKLGVAVGIIHSSWGATITETWTSRETLSRNPDMTARLARYEATLYDPEFWSDYAELELSNAPRIPDNQYPADPGNTGIAQGWALAAFDDQTWPIMKLPSAWTLKGHHYSGIFWFRKTVDIPAAWTGKDLWLCLGAVDKQDIAYFNGEQVGATGTGFEEQHWNEQREYRVPGRLVKAGKKRDRRPRLFLRLRRWSDRTGQPDENQTGQRQRRRLHAVAGRVALPGRAEFRAGGRSTAQPRSRQPEQPVHSVR